MRYTIRIAPVLLLLAGSTVPLGCGGRKTEAPEPGPRPVTVLELEEINPIRSRQLTGAVKAWKEQDVAFEVEGRVEFIVESGTDLRGHWEEGGKVEVTGDVLARLDPQSFQIAKDIAEVGVRVAKQQLHAAEVRLKQVLSANLEAAAAEKKRAQAEYERIAKARKTGAVSELELIRAEADRDARAARYEQAAAAIEAQKAEVEALEAHVEETQQQLNDAQYDLDRCTLYAPFTGQVSRVDVEAGGYAHRGEAVAHLVMMDPIKVDLALSANRARQLGLHSAVHISLPGQEEPVLGSVYEKATVADPETRTFRVSIITRNWRTGGKAERDPSLAALPRIAGLMSVQRAQADDPDSPWVVEENLALRKDENGYFVWVTADLKRGDRVDPDHPVVTLKKARVTPTDLRVNFQGLFLMRGLTDLGDLTPDALVALNVPEDFKEGGQALVLREEWLLRPGQTVQVFLGETLPATGIYVPMNAIKPVDETNGEVFLVTDEKARKLGVKMVENVGELYRIQAANPDEAGLLVPGALLITNKIHFLQDGESVRIVKTEKVTP